MANDKRKHYTQMNTAELKLLKKALSGKKFKLSDHLKDRMREKNVTVSDLQTLLQKFSIIECHNNVPNDIRVLVRNEAGCCAVLSIVNLKIITTYWNSTTDHHSTLDTSAYAWNVDLTQTLARG